MVTDASVWATATEGDGGSGAPSVTVKLKSNVSGLVPLHVFVGVWPTQASVVLVRDPWYGRTAVQPSAFGSEAVTVPVKVPPLLPPSNVPATVPEIVPEKLKPPTGVAVYVPVIGCCPAEVVPGILAKECGLVLVSFFKNLRQTP